MRIAPGSSAPGPSGIEAELARSARSGRSANHGSGLMIAVGCSLLIWAALATLARWAANFF